MVDASAQLVTALDQLGLAFQSGMAAMVMTTHGPLALLFVIDIPAWLMWHPEAGICLHPYWYWPGDLMSPTDGQARVVQTAMKCVEPSDEELTTFTPRELVLMLYHSPGG